MNKIALTVLGLMLFCNVIAVGIYLFQTQAEWIDYGNLFGCVVFGIFIDTIIKGD